MFMHDQESTFTLMADEDNGIVRDQNLELRINENHLNAAELNGKISHTSSLLATEPNLELQSDNALNEYGYLMAHPDSNPENFRNSKTNIYDGLTNPADTSDPSQARVNNWR